MDRGVTRIICYYQEQDRILVMCLSNCPHVMTMSDEERVSHGPLQKCKSPAKYLRSPLDTRVNLTDLAQPPTLCTNKECCTLALPPNITLKPTDTVLDKYNASRYLYVPSAITITRAPFLPTPTDIVLSVVGFPVAFKQKPRPPSSLPF
jgi:hypothetical protein